MSPVAPPHAVWSLDNIGPCSALTDNATWLLPALRVVCLDQYSFTWLQDGKRLCIMLFLKVSLLLLLHVHALQRTGTFWESGSRGGKVV